MSKKNSDRYTNMEIIREIKFAPEQVGAGLSILSYFGSVVRIKYPDIPVKITLEQEDKIVRLKVQTPDGYRETIEKSLDNYGLVVAGKLAQEDLYGDLKSADTFKAMMQVAEALLIPIISVEDEPSDNVSEVIGSFSAAIMKQLQKSPESIFDLDSRQFEELVAEILASFGWKVRLTASTRDGGYDVFGISKDEAAGVETSWLVECKKYAPDRKVGVEVIRSLYGVNMDIQASNILVATTSMFSKGVRDVQASRYNLSLKDYSGVLEWVNSYRPNPNGKLYLSDNKLILP